MDFKVSFADKSEQLRTSFEQEQSQLQTSFEQILKGGDGISPVAYVTEEEDGATITITDANGTTTAKVKSADPKRVEALEERVTKLELNALDITFEFID